MSDLLKKYGEAYGIKIETNEISKKIKQELRYIIIIEIIHENKRYSFSNIKPNKNIKEAKEIALKKVKKKIKFNLTDKNFITFSCLEILFSDVPVEKLLKENATEMQAIQSRWLSNEELEDLMK